MMSGVYTTDGVPLKVTGQDELGAQTSERVIPVIVILFWPIG